MVNEEPSLIISDYHDFHGKSLENYSEALFRLRQSLLHSSPQAQKKYDISSEG